MTQETVPRDVPRPHLALALVGASDDDARDARASADHLARANERTNERLSRCRSIESFAPTDPRSFVDRLISIDVDRFREHDATIIANDGVVRDARDRGGACYRSMTRRDSLDARARDARGRRREMKDEGRTRAAKKGRAGTRTPRRARDDPTTREGERMTDDGATRAGVFVFLRRDSR
jgi:hypothetical protein|tara:strand:- start:6004 stop:6540 length:537 start_codon:yes stop_codon:yes gene_type:complete